jgi:hypothetical protein
VADSGGWNDGSEATPDQHADSVRTAQLTADAILHLAADGDGQRPDRELLVGYSSSSSVTMETASRRSGRS